MIYFHSKTFQRTNFAQISSYGRKICTDFINNKANHKTKRWRDSKANEGQIKLSLNYYESQIDVARTFCDLFYLLVILRRQMAGWKIADELFTFFFRVNVTKMSRFIRFNFMLQKSAEIKIIDSKAKSRIHLQTSISTKRM